jgi:hypothetical protein
LLTDKFDLLAAATQLGWHPELPRRIEMDSNEKIRLWLKMGETIGVPLKQIQTVRDVRKCLPDGGYEVSWVERFGADSIEDAAQLALVMLYANGSELRPQRFLLTVENREGVITKVDLSGSKFLTALQAGLKRCYPDSADNDKQEPIELVDAND